MVDDDGPVGLDGVRVSFDDERVVSDAGIALVATLAERLGIERLAQRLVRLRPDQPGAASAGRKVIALIYAMALGTDSIEDCDVLRRSHAPAARRLAAGAVDAGDAFARVHVGHVRQLDRLLGETLTRAWKAGAGPGDGRLVVDVDSFVGVCRLAEAGLLRASFVPPKPIRQLRNLTRYRKTQIQERARGQPAAQGARGRRHQARLRRDRHPRQVRARHARRARARDHRPRRPGAACPAADAQEDPRAARGARRTL